MFILLLAEKYFKYRNMKQKINTEYKYLNKHMIIKGIKLHDTHIKHNYFLNHTQWMCNDIPYLY